MLTRRSLISAATGLIAAPRILRAGTAAENIDISVTTGSGSISRGPQPIPQPYPLQPGFVPITDLNQIQGSGKYQLTADSVASLANLIEFDDLVIDGSGHTLSGVVLELTGANVTLKNLTLIDTWMYLWKDNVTIDNCSIIFNDNSKIPLYTIHMRNATTNLIVRNCYINGTSDDLIILAISDPGVVRSFQAINNIFVNAPDMAIEGVTRWDNCIIQNNLFKVCNVGAGNFVNGELNNCIIKDNQAERATCRHIFFFGDFEQDDDTVGNQAYGSRGTVFSGNGWI